MVLMSLLPEPLESTSIAPLPDTPRRLRRRCCRRPEAVVVRGGPVVVVVVVIVGRPPLSAATVELPEREGATVDICALVVAARLHARISGGSSPFSSSISVHVRTTIMGVLAAAHSCV